VGVAAFEAHRRRSSWRLTKGKQRVTTSKDLAPGKGRGDAPTNDQNRAAADRGITKEKLSETEGKDSGREEMVRG